MGHELKPYIAKGEEQWDENIDDFPANSTHVAYNYRHTDGDQFYCQSPTLAQCRQKRDAWLKQKQQQ
jgi:hypothetical protein